MKTKLVFSTEKKDFEHWIELPIIPHLNEWFNVQDILEPEKVIEIKKSAFCWSGVRGKIQSVEHRHHDNDFYVEVFVWCED